MADKKGKPTKKETEMAKNMVKAMIGCKPMKCDDLAPCKILCKKLECGEFSDKVRPEVSIKGWPCPTQVVCEGFKCSKVKCTKLKEQ